MIGLEFKYLRDIRNGVFFTPQFFVVAGNFTFCLI